MWMIERRQRFGFALKARQPVTISREGVGRDLDGNFAVEPAIGGARQTSPMPPSQSLAVLR